MSDVVRGLVLIVFVLQLVVDTPLAAQALTPDDTAAAIAVVYERVSTRWGKPANIAEPVWIPDSIYHGTYIGEDTWVALERRIPTIRRTNDVASVVVCPEGKEHVYPRGCPILGFGRILSLRLEETEAGREVIVTVSVGLMASKDRSYLFGGTCRVRRQANGDWVITEILDLRIT